MLDDLEARARHYRSVLEDARADQLMKNWVMRLLDDLDKAIKIGQALLIIDKEKVYLRYRRALERIIQRACRHCSAYETAAGAYGISWAKRPDDPIIAMRTGRDEARLAVRKMRSIINEHEQFGGHTARKEFRQVRDVVKWLADTA